jgi:phosphoglycolate phosphatase-like HAD superfamily hydrolase
MALRYEAIVFDFDGVLVESMDLKTQAFATLYRPYGEEVVSKVVAHHLAHGGVSRAKKFRHYHETLLGIRLTPENEIALAQRFSELVEDAVVAAPPVPGAIEFLEKFFRVLPLFVASGTPEDELRRIVERRGMSPYFAGVFGAPRVKGEILSHIAAVGGFPRASMLMVGDAYADYEGASAAGTDFIGRGKPSSGLFPPGVRLISDLTSLPALL